MRAMAGLADRRIDDALADLASRETPAAAGVAAVLACASAASLVELTAGLAADRLAGGECAEPELEARMRALGSQAGELRARLPALADADADAYARVSQASDPSARADALERATEPPLELATLAAAVAGWAGEVAAAGDWPFTPDALAAARLANAAAGISAALVAANAGADDPRAERAREAAQRARLAAG
jgi:formiminotetrahydrofolate cyclodeaminase